MRLLVFAAACRAADGHLGARDPKGGALGCRWRQHGEWCALERQGETLRLALERMASAGVPANRARTTPMLTVPADPPRESRSASFMAAVECGG